MLADDDDAAVRDGLSAAMVESVQQLRLLVERVDPAQVAMERAEIETVAQNIAALDQAVRAATIPAARLSPAQEWRTVLLAFDELAGRDMRELLRDAVARHEAASLRESALLAEALGRIRLVGALLAISVVLGAVLAVLHFVRRLDTPFARLSAITQALAGGDYRVRSELVGRDEFAQIGRLLDTMAERVEAAQMRSVELQRNLDQLVGQRTRALTQAYETLLGIEGRRRQFFAELSHELRTPVTIIRGEAEIALRHPDDATEVKAALGRVVEVAGELGGRVQDLLEAARGTAMDYAVALQPVALAEIVTAAVGQMQAVAAHRGVLLELDAVPQALEIEADRDRLQQALVIVLDNALRYSPPESRVCVGVTVEDEHVWVQVEDEGPGMAEEDFAHAFEPHYRGAVGRARDPSGSGIGLAIARRIVLAHRGSIELNPRQPHGLLVGIGLPTP
jgi:signal transduction histidine kinase